jgi:hypothetical protein
MKTENTFLQDVENSLNISDSVIDIFTEKDRPMKQVVCAIKQEVLGRTNRLLSFDMTRIS